MSKVGAVQVEPKMSGTSSSYNHLQAPSSSSRANISFTPPALSPPPPDDVERTATGIPIRLIWLPYVGLTLLLLGMMCMSFFHYHRKNGHKYRRRREELLKALAAAGENNVVGAGETPANGGFTISPEQPVNPFHHRPPKQNPHFQVSPTNEEPELYTIRNTKKQPPLEEKDSGQPTQSGLLRQNSSSIFRQISAPQGSSSKQPAYSPRGVPLVTPKPQPQSAPAEYPPPQYPPVNVVPKHGRAADSSSSLNPRRPKKPLVFTSNLNGSMVDIRCGVNESHRTFKPKSSRSSSLPSTSIWTLPHLSSRAQQHHHQYQLQQQQQQQQQQHYQQQQQQYQQQQQQQYPYQYQQQQQQYYNQRDGGGGGPTSTSPPPGGYAYDDYGRGGGGGGRYDDYWQGRGGGGGGGPYSPTGQALPNIMSDCEDDDVFLLHQTKL